MEKKKELTREIVLSKIEGYLNHKEDMEDIYQWALSAAVSDEYEKISRKDVLLAHSVQLLIDIKRGQKRPNELQERLEYHQRCLKGECTYVPKATFVAIRQEEKPTDFFIIIRIYIMVFAVCSIIVNIISIINPQFLQFGKEAIPRLDALQDAIPHLIYAAVLLIPLKISTRGFLFLPVFMVLTYGMLSYWYIPIQLVQELSLNPVFILIVLPFSSMPASLALIQLVSSKKKT